MIAAATFIAGGGKVREGESFTVASEEDARLYEQKGLASRVQKTTKSKEPERTQDVQAEESSGSRGARPTKKRSTKSEE